MLKRQKLGGVKLAAELGLDGLEVDMGGLGDRPAFDNQLRDPAVRQQYFDACKEHNVEICSIAASAFYAQSYADHPAADACTEDWIETMRLMNVRVGFLPMGVKSNVKDDARIRQTVIDRLKRHAPAAEKAGVILGIEAQLSADEYKRFFDEVGSPAVKAYYDCAGRLDAGADIYAELCDLGNAKRLCQIHSTDKDGKLLKNSRIDLAKLKSALDEINYHGWLVLERSRVSGKTMKQDFAANAALLRSIFQG
jgi:sugar phosphate isomerase/epimerase